jgi:hypothetical protein
MPVGVWPLPSPGRYPIFDLTKLKRRPCCERIQQAEKKPRTGRGKSKGGNGPPTGRHEYGPDSAREL